MLPRLSRALPALVLAALLVGLSACDSSDPAPTIGGTYRGSAVVGGFGTVTFQLVMPTVRSGATFRYTGTAQLTGEAPDPFAGSGEYDHPDIEMTDDDDPNDVIRGTVSADGRQISLVDPESQQTILLTR